MALTLSHTDQQASVAALDLFNNEARSRYSIGWIPTPKLENTGGWDDVGYQALWYRSESCARKRSHPAMEKQRYGNHFPVRATSQ
jgi:hypothetical protein